MTGASQARGRTGGWQFASGLGNSAQCTSQLWHQENLSRCRKLHLTVVRGIRVLDEPKELERRWCCQVEGPESPLLSLLPLLSAGLLFLTLFSSSQETVETSQMASGGILSSASPCRSFHPWLWFCASWVQSLAGSWAGCRMLCLKSLAWKLCLVCAFAVPFFILLVPGTAAFSLYLGKSCLLEMDLFLKSFVFSFLEFPSPSPEVLLHFTCTALPLFSCSYVCMPLCP